MPLRAWRMGLVSSVLVELEGHPSGETLSHVSSQVGGVRRPESGVVGWAGPGGRARAGRWPGVAGPGAPVGADRQGCERGSQGGLAGRGNGRRRRQHRGHAPAVDDTIIEVHGHAKQGAGFGYSGVRGLKRSWSTGPNGRGTRGRGPGVAGLCRRADQSHSTTTRTRPTSVSTAIAPWSYRGREPLLRSSASSTAGGGWLRGRRGPVATGS